MLGQVQVNADFFALPAAETRPETAAGANSAKIALKK